MAIAATNECPPDSRPWVLAATILGSSMAFIDGSVVSVALPAMQADLNTSVRGAQWIVNAYMLVLGALMLVGGAAGDRYGRRRIFMVGVIVFTAASVACGLAPNVGALVAARALQGLGGALMVPESLAIITAAFPEAERGRAIGTWAGFSALTTAFGPVLGGWLVDASSWRMIFFVNVPFGIATLVLAMWHVPESRDTSEGSVDWRGGLLVTAGLVAIAYGLTAASELGWHHPVVLGFLIGSLVPLGAFLWWESRARAPMMPLELFRSPQFSGANILTLLLYFAVSGAMFFIPFELIRVRGLSAMQAGAAFLPFTLVMGGLSRWSGGLIQKYGARLPLTVGPIIVAIGLALCAIPGVDTSYWVGFFPAMIVLGLGMAVSVAPLTTTVMHSAGEHHSGVASGVNNAISRVAGMLAVALLGAVAVGEFSDAIDEKLPGARVPQEVRQTLHAEASKLAEAEAPKWLAQDAKDRVTRVLHEAFIQSVRLTMLIAAGLALFSAVCAWLTMPGRTQRTRSTRRFRA
jgi:EmrB/QacA subfamily drug resistance transporter